MQATRPAFASTSALPPARSSSVNSNKRRSPSSSLSASAHPAKRRESPATTAARCTPVEAAKEATPTAAPAPLSQSDREMQMLFELEYQEDVKTYMYEMEAKTQPSVDLIDQQPELQWYMRPYLVDFLIEVHQQHRLRPETLYLALNMVDRYVSKRIVFKKHYQLVGCAALWIAAKFEDAKERVPTVPELSAMCCGAYDDNAFIQMESHVISTLGWNLGHPTAEAWLRLACVSGQMEEQQTQHVARFLMEITLFHREYISYKPSDLAMAALLLARYMLRKPRRVQDETEEVITIIRTLDQQLTAHLDELSNIIVKKYSMPFYGRSSTFVQEYYLKGGKFSYNEWQRASPSPLTSPLSASPTSSGASSYGLHASPASSTSSTADYDEPLTPGTPLPPYSTMDPFVIAGVKEAPASQPGSKRSSPQGQQMARSMSTAKVVSQGMVGPAVGSMWQAPQAHDMSADVTTAPLYRP